MQNLNKTEKTILASALLLFLFSGFLILFGGIERIQDLALGRDPIGTIEEFNNDVRHKSENSLNWTKTVNKAKVYEMDSVFTGDNSHARVHLKDGSQIGIDPNSLVIISLIRNQANFNLTYGNLWSEMGPNTKLVIKTGEKTYELSSSEKPQRIRVSQKRKGELKVEVPEGRVTLKEDNKPARVIVPEVIVAEIPPPVEIPPTPLEAPSFILPQDQQIFAFEFPEETPLEAAVKELDVSWSASSDFKSYDLQVASDPEFKSIVQENKIEKNELQTTPLPSGNYWMRVRGLDTKEVFTSWSAPLNVTLQLSIQPPQEIPAPLLTNPKISYIRNSLNAREPASIPPDQKVSWIPVPKATKYKLEYAKNLNFQKAKVIETAGSEMIFKTETPGIYYYRVFAIGKSKTSEPSKIGTVEVLPSKISLSEIPEIEKVGLTPKPIETTLSWNPVEGATSYAVELATKSDFSDAQKISFPENSGPVTLPKPGRYQVRVQAFNESEEPLSEVSIAQSLAYKFRNSLKPPSLVEPFHESSLFIQDQKKAAIWLEWKKVNGASSYEIEVSKSETFNSPVLKTEVKGNRYLITQQLPLGKIYWRVRARSTNQEDAVSDWTSHKEFTLHHQKNESFIK